MKWDTKLVDCFWKYWIKLLCFEFERKRQEQHQLIFAVKNENNRQWLIQLEIVFFFFLARSVTRRITLKCFNEDLCEGTTKSMFNVHSFQTIVKFNMIFLSVPISKSFICSIHMHEIVFNKEFRCRKNKQNIFIKLIF